MPNPRDQKLQQLAAVAQLFGVMQRAQESQQQDALAKLGLTQQGEHQKALLEQQQAALAQQGLWHQDEVSQRQAAQDLQMQALQSQQTNEAAKLGLDSAQFQQKLGLDKDNQNRMLQQQMLQGAVQLPGMTPEAYAQMGSSLGVPGVDKFISQGQDTMAQGQAAALQQMLGPIYSGFGENPKRSQEALNMIWQDPRMGSPRVQEKLAPWLDQQNNALYQPAVQAGGLTQADIPQDLQGQFGDIQSHNAELAKLAQAQQLAEEERKKRLKAVNYIDRSKTGIFQGGGFAGFR